MDERERIHLLLIDDAKLALKDVQAGRTFEADPALEPMQARRAAQCNVALDARFGTHSAELPELDHDA